MSPLLNLIGILMASYSYFLAINLALYNLLYLASIKALFIRNSILLIYRPTIPKGLLL